MIDYKDTLALSKRFGCPYIEIPDEFKYIQKSVFKLYYNEKYVILMGKRLERQVDIVRENLAYFFNRGYNIVIKKKEIYQDKKNKKPVPIDFCLYFYRHIKDNPNGTFSFELISCTTNPYTLLKSNQLALDESLSDSNCLNLNINPVVAKSVQDPKLYEQGKKWGWVNRGHYLNFRKWQYSRYVI